MEWVILILAGTTVLLFGILIGFIVAMKFVLYTLQKIEASRMQALTEIQKMSGELGRSNDDGDGDCDPRWGKKPEEPPE